MTRKLLQIYGDNCEMYMDDKGELLLTKKTETIDSSNNEVTTTTTTFRPIGSVAYDEVKITKLIFKLMNDSKNTIEVTLEISGNGKMLWSNTVSIVPLSDKLTV